MSEIIYVSRLNLPDADVLGRLLDFANEMNVSDVRFGDGMLKGDALRALLRYACAAAGAQPEGYLADDRVDLLVSR